MALISHPTAEKMARTGWTVARFAGALFFFTWFPLTAVFILGQALGQFIFGDRQEKAKVKNLGLNPFNWMKEYQYLWFIFGAEVAVAIAFAFGAYMPAIASFYIALWPTILMMNWIGLCALGLALLIGLAYLILKPSEPQQYMFVPAGHVHQGVPVAANQFQQGHQSVYVAQPMTVEYFERLGPGHVLGDGTVSLASPVQ